MNDTLRVLSAVSVFCLFVSCYPQAPVTSTVTVDMERPATPLNRALYGLSAGNGSVGALRSEMINNGDFNAGDSLPGWTAAGSYAYLARSSSRPLEASNEFSLMVAANPWPGGRAGAAATGFGGLQVKGGRSYRVSFYMRTSSSVTPAVVEVALEDTAGARLCEPFEVMPSYNWTLCRRQVTAAADSECGALSFSMREASLFLIDEVSLLPADDLNEFGLRRDAMLALDSLLPAFVLSDGAGKTAGAMAEGLGAELIGDSADAGWERLAVNGSWMMRGWDLRSGIKINGFEGAGLGGSAVGWAADLACFLVKAEGMPRSFERIAFNPVAARYGAGGGGEPLLLAGPGGIVRSSLYYLLRMFTANRGNAVLPAEVDTYLRPMVEEASPGFESADGSFEAEAVTVSRSLAYDSAYNYEVAARLKPLSDSPSGVLRVTPTVFLSVGGGGSVLYRLAGSLRDTLSVASVSARPGELCSLRVLCSYDTVKCFLGDQPIHRAVNPSLPSLTAIASLGDDGRTVILKVVNPTPVVERTRIVINGARVRRRVETERLAVGGVRPGAGNELGGLAPVVAVEKLGGGGSPVYDFPPNSVTLMRLRID
ncbi:MAG: hypothetical protein LBC81_04605 [Tannerellaceae bacterium]|jgi:hypothetical protein|nr:hypothetical protein [Tannerellaceae bacterium]